MTKEGKLVLILLISVLLVQLVSAIDTEINIKTMPDHEVQATAYDPARVSFNAFETFKGISDEYGDVSFVFSSDKFKFNLIVYIKKDGEKIMVPEKFLDNKAGEHLDLRIAPSYFEFIETPVNETNVTEESNETAENETLIEETAEETTEEETIIEETQEESTAGITGSVIGDFFSNRIFYYIIGAFALLVIIFVTSKLTQYKLSRKLSGRGDGKTKSKNIKVKKLSDLKREKKEMQEVKKEKIEDFKGTIDDAEKKIKEAQEEIKKLRDRDEISAHEAKIREAKKKLEEDERALLSLRGNKD